MMRFSSLVPSVALVIMLATPTHTSAFKTNTHELINRAAATQSPSTDLFLRRQLGFARGLFEPLDGSSALDWIGYGGVAEDELAGSETLGGLTRSARHFHTPLLGWDQSGLSLPPLPRLESSVRWAQSNQGALGRAAWRDARTKFFTAATEAAASARRKSYAEAFRILGQLMHLVADLAQPGHARDESHALGDPFESFLAHDNNLHWIAGFNTFDPGILQVVTNDSVAIVPVAHIWDANRYNGTNPPDETNSSMFGLAEISSANFFSAGTISARAYEDPVRPLPALDVLDLSRTAMYITGELRQYFGKSGHGIPVDSLVAEGTFYRFLPPFVVNVGLDDIVLGEYARHLLPRAIGYSAGLLEYFFRGRIDIAAPDRFAYGLTGFETGNTGSFATLRFKVRNATPGEDAGPGEMRAVVQYRRGLTGESLIDNPSAPISGELHYAVSRPISLALTPEFQEISFAFDSPIPTNAADLFLTVVHKGRLGLEEDAVMVGGKDLMEPTSLDLVNGTDWECFEDQLHYVADLAAYPAYSPAQPQRDVNRDGRVDLFGPDVARGMFLKSFDLALPRPLPSETNFDLAIAVGTPAQHARVLLLQDRPFYGASALVREAQSVPAGSITRNVVHSSFALPGVVNDTVPGPDGQLLRRMPPPYAYRGVPTHNVLVLLVGAGTLSCFDETQSLPPTLTRIEGTLPAQ